MLHLGFTGASLFKEEDDLVQAKLAGDFQKYEELQQQRASLPMEEGPMLKILKALQPLMNPIFAEQGLLKTSLFSRGGQGTGSRILGNLERSNLIVNSAFFTDGGSRSELIQAMGVDMFFTTSENDARRVLQLGTPSCRVSPHIIPQLHDGKVYILLDVDAVLVDDSSEKVAKQSIADFQMMERTCLEKLNAGPIASFASKLCELRQNTDLIKIGILTARSPLAHRRVMEFFQEKGISPDFQAYMGGQAKGPIAKAIGATILLDDHIKNCKSVEDHGVLSGHVLFGVNNPEPELEVI